MFGHYEHGTPCLGQLAQSGRDQRRNFGIGTMESGDDEKRVEPREVSLTDTADTQAPLLSADPADPEKAEEEKSRELQLNEDPRVCPNLVPNLCYAFAFFLGLCIAMFLFARDPQMGSTLAEKNTGISSCRSA